MKNIKQIPTEHLIIALYEVFYKALQKKFTSGEFWSEKYTEILNELKKRGGLEKNIKKICKESFKALGLEKLL